MIRLMLSDCQQPLDCEHIGDDVQLTGFSIDTRTLQPGDLYIALSGERFDGHEFCAQAETSGAIALLVSKQVDSNLPQLIVDDTEVALSQLGKLWADGYQVPTIAVTGSNGKTTLKEMIASILGKLGPVLATEGNLNNHIGVPLTLLKLRSHHRYAVIEMGANHVGEIAALTRLVRPDVAVVNNIGAAHLEGFGSIEDVAAAKAEIFSGVFGEGCAIINGDDAFSDVMHDASTHCRRRYFGTADDSDVQLLDGKQLRLITAGKTLSPRFALLGKHNRMNAAAATAAAQCMDVQPVAIMSGLADVVAVNGRLQSKFGKRGSTIIDDTYNANPVSVKAAIDVLAEFSGIRHLVLGDMGELGEAAQANHIEIGRYAKQAGIDHLWAIGPLCRFTVDAFGSARHFDDKTSLITAIRAHLTSDCTVLVKGSRTARMEEVVGPLVDKHGAANVDMSLDATADTIEAISL